MKTRVCLKYFMNNCSLFHSITVDEKKNLFEKVMFCMKKNNFICFSGIIIRIFCCCYIEKVNWFIIFNDITKYAKFHAPTLTLKGLQA